MSSPFVAEIRIFAGTFAPTGWALCDGQVLPITQNTALFSLIGTFYGGDGKSTFALPNLQGNAPMFWGSGPGLTLHDIGENGGTEQETLTPSTLPAHSHSLYASGAAATTTNPAESLLARTQEDSYAQAGTPQAMAAASITQAGSSLPHNNLQPYLVVNFIIALQGIFPARS